MDVAGFDEAGGAEIVEEEGVIAAEAGDAGRQGRRIWRGGW